MLDCTDEIVGSEVEQQLRIFDACKIEHFLDQAVKTLALFINESKGP